NSGLLISISSERPPAMRTKARKRLSTPLTMPPAVAPQLWPTYATRLGSTNGEEKIGAAADIDNHLNEILDLLGGKRVLVGNVSWAREREIDQKRRGTGGSKGHGFVQKFLAIAELRIRPTPMAPNYGRKWPFARRQNQIGRHATAFGAGVGKIVNTDGTSEVHADVLSIERRLRLVIESVRVIGLLSEGGNAYDEKGHKHAAHGTPPLGQCMPAGRRYKRSFQNGLHAIGQHLHVHVPLPRPIKLREENSLPPP